MTLTLRKGIPSDFDETNALKEHYEKLLERRQQLDILISNVQKTILTKEGKMSSRTSC